MRRCAMRYIDAAAYRQNTPPRNILHPFSPSPKDILIKSAFNDPGRTVFAGNSDALSEAVLISVSLI